MTSRANLELRNKRFSDEQRAAYDQLHTAFPRVDMGWLSAQIWSGATFDTMVDKMINADVYRVPCVGRVSAPCPDKCGFEGEELATACAVSKTFPEQNIAISMLANKFGNLNLTHLRTLYYACGNNYWKTANAIKQQFPPEKHDQKQVIITIDQPDGRRRSIILCVNKLRRCVRGLPIDMPSYLTDQDRLIEQGSQVRNDEPEEPFVIPEGAEDDGLFECVICAGEKPMAASCNCSSGHVFCGECVADYFKESIYGQAKASLVCMENDCKGHFAIQDVKKFVSRDAIKKLGERQDEEALVALGIDKITRCKYCNYAAIVETDPEVDKVFSCKRCEAQICRVCGEDWDDRHIGFKCDELNKNDAETKRRQFEERMSKLVIRECHRCGLPIQKSDGCNKMTCSCKATMCYLCRARNVDYKHFCAHGRQPGKPCTICRRCSLWEDVNREEEKQLRTIQEAANQELEGADKIEVMADKAPAAPRPPPPPPRPPPREEDYVCWPAAPAPPPPRGRGAAQRAQQVAVQQAGGAPAANVVAGPQLQRPNVAVQRQRHRLQHRNRILVFFRRIFNAPAAPAR